MEAWYQMQENIENSPNMHTQGVIIKSLYNGVSAWARLLLDGLTNGQLATGDPSFAKYTLLSLFGIVVRQREKLSFNNSKKIWKK
jgi:hypothetical protein